MVVMLLSILALLVFTLSLKNVKSWIRWPLWAVVSLAIIVVSQWSGIINLILPYETRPEKISFDVEKATEEQFDVYAEKLATRLKAEPSHVEIFRKNNIRSYEGPETCLLCHRQIELKIDGKATGMVDLRHDITNSVHFTFAPKTGFSTYGFNGEKVESFPLGKMDRACGVTGTFTWTGWAALIPTAHGDTISEGCGQCHIVGQYGPISGAMMPGYRPIDAEWDATDCLICHAAEYDMNYRQVVRDPNGKLRWQHDRRLISAMSVGVPKAQNCLHCHQHNLGGDTYPGNVDNLVNVGYEYPRLGHAGAKRGTPFGADWDVHAAAGMECLDCHIPLGHKIPRGRLGTDLVANDRPDFEVSCLGCHGETPHTSGENAGIYNSHIEKIACETCHINRLFPDNLVFRDWTTPVYNEAHGIYTPRNAPFSGDPGSAIDYRWFNGNGTFMANALGDNPNRKGLYRSLNTTPNSDWSGIGSFSYEDNYEKVFRPIASSGQSKIYPFKKFQAVMYEDLNNQGPYGGMILPIDYYTYYTTGDAREAVRVASEKKIMRMMYGAMFKHYLMDRFMAYMAIDGWNTDFSMERIAPRPMRNEGQLMINHSIARMGRACGECHTPAGGLLDFAALGYTPEETSSLQEPR